MLNGQYHVTGWTVPLHWLDSTASLAGQYRFTGWTVPLHWLDSTTSLTGQYHVSGWTVSLHWLDSTTSLATLDLLLVGSTVCVTHGQYRCSSLAIYSHCRPVGWLLQFCS